MASPRKSLAEPRKSASEPPKEEEPSDRGSGEDVPGDTSFSDIRGTLFGAGQLLDVTEELREEVERVALRQLQSLVLPLVRMARARRLRAARGGGRRGAEVSRVADALRQSPLLSFWPDEQLQRLASDATALTAEEGETVIHEGESAASGVYVLLRGRVQVVKRGVGIKSVSPSNPANTVIATLDAQQVLGDFTQLTEQPRTASVRAINECDWVVVPSASFARELAILPERVQQRVYDAAFSRRKEIMWTIFPMSFDDLRRSFLFAHFSDEQLSVIVQRLQPRCYRQGEHLCHFGTSGAEMFFLRRGEVDVLVPQLPPAGQQGGDDPDSPGGRTQSPSADGRTSPSAFGGRTSPTNPSPTRRRSTRRMSLANAEMRCVATLPQGACFGEFSLVFGEKRTATIRAKTHCDVWILLFANLEMCFADPELSEKVRQAAVAQRLKFLRQQENKTLKCVGPDGVDREGRDALLKYAQSCPLLRETCDLKCLSDVRRALEPRCYKARDILISSSQICDRLLVLTRGRAFVQQNVREEKQFLHVGEVIGFTCLAEHRWRHAVVACEPCDVWELPRTRLAEILKQHGCLSKALALTRKLLTADPSRPPCDVSQHTPSMFPVMADADPMCPPKVISFAAGSSDRGAVADRQLAERSAQTEDTIVRSLRQQSKPQQQNPADDRQAHRRRSLRLSVALSRGEHNDDDTLAAVASLTDTFEGDLVRMTSPQRAPAAAATGSDGEAVTPVRTPGGGEAGDGRTRTSFARPASSGIGRRGSVSSVASSTVPLSPAGSPARAASQLRRQRQSPSATRQASPTSNLSSRADTEEDVASSPGARLRLRNQHYEVGSYSGGEWPGFPIQNVLKTTGDEFHSSGAESGAAVTLSLVAKADPVALSRIEVQGTVEGSCSVQSGVVWALSSAAAASFPLQTAEKWTTVRSRRAFDRMCSLTSSQVPDDYFELPEPGSTAQVDIYPAREVHTVVVQFLTTHGDDTNIDIGKIRLLGPSRAGDPGSQRRRRSLPPLAVGQRYQDPSHGRGGAWESPTESPRASPRAASPLGSPRGTQRSSFVRPASALCGDTAAGAEFEDEARQWRRHGSRQRAPR
eukprot:TRINITY_DN19289_c0_g1_i1.p1 TRINITY_DN19289_c0_g1~~TRINITY_DN19289_c0_g1_i1.p1  ORF type:complete len:1115 (+),score=230.43 TRINITY_DN19289_c0_g1_i1:67-3345(+)